MSNEAESSVIPRVLASMLRSFEWSVWWDFWIFTAHRKRGVVKRCPQKKQILLILNPPFFFILKQKIHPSYVKFSIRGTLWSWIPSFTRVDYFRCCWVMPPVKLPKNEPQTTPQFCKLIESQLVSRSAVYSHRWTDTKDDIRKFVSSTSAKSQKSIAPRLLLGFICRWHLSWNGLVHRLVPRAHQF